MASYFAPPAQNVPASGVRRAPLDLRALRQAYAQGAGGADEVRRLATNSQYMSKTNPGDTLKSFERDVRSVERADRRQEKRDAKWQSEQGTKGGYYKKSPTYSGLVNTASYGGVKLAEMSVAELIAAKSPHNENPRIFDLLPFLGALGGAYMSLRRPGGAAKFLGLDKSLPKATRVALGAGAGSTIGFLPGVTYDAHNAMFGKASSYESALDAPLVKSLSKVAVDAHKLGEGEALKLIKQSCWPLPDTGTQGLMGGAFKTASVAERGVHIAAAAVKDSLGSASATYRPKIRDTFIRAAEEGAKLAAHSVLRAAV